MNKNISKILIIIIIYNYIYFASVSYASQLIGTTTGHSQKEASETLAAWCIDFYNKHQAQCIYDDDSWLEPREISYTLPVSDSDTSTIYEFDCVGWVSFAIHHALGLGEETFTYFAVPDDCTLGDGKTVGNSFEQVYVNFEDMQPGDIFVYTGHVGVCIGNGQAVHMTYTTGGGLLNGPISGSGVYSGYVGRITEEAARNANFNYMPGAGGADTLLEMKGNQMADCAIQADGERGDASGIEWQVTDWFRDGSYYEWDTVYRHPDEKVARTIATIAIKAAKNDAIGYILEDPSFGEELEKANFDVTAITSPCASHCSWSTSNVVKAAGYQLNMQELMSIPLNSWTDEADYPSRGFQVLTDSKYLTSPDELLAGDILRTTKGLSGHVNIFVGNGKIGKGDKKISYPIDDITINLDDQQFEFGGLPKTAIYSGNKKAGQWIFEKISQFIDFIVSIITNGIKMSILGWAIATETIIDASIKFLEGSQ